MRETEILIGEPEKVEIKPNKIKIALIFLVSVLLVATTVILLIGHFQFDWFKSDEYKIDAKIRRSLYQTNYFSEIKTLYTKFSFKDHTEERQYILDNNFVVFLTEKKDNINNGVLVLLSSTAFAEDKMQEMPHLNIFDEEQIKELEANPNGAKYPMAVFKFTDEGKMEGIKLPYNMDQYNAESIIEFINKVTPKLLRNKKEDMSKGLEITSKKVNNKNIIIKSEAHKQFEDFNGNKITKYVKTEIENEQITNVESKDNLYMEAKPEGNEIIYGPKDFSYDINSKITSKEVKFNEKENVELVKRLISKFALIDSEEFLKIIANSKKENSEAQEKTEIVDEKENKSVRKLSFEINASKSFQIASFNVMEQNITVTYEVGVSKNNAYNKIVISAGAKQISFGNDGCAGKISFKCRC